MIEAATIADIRLLASQLSDVPALRRWAHPQLGDPFLHQGIEILLKHIERFKYDRTPGSKLPRANAWRPYRFAIQDVIFAATAIRHSQELKCTEVDVFLTDDFIEGYDEYAATRALALLLLSEAFRCGVPLALRFTGNVEGGRVPRALLQLAQRQGIRIPDPQAGWLRPAEGSQLYAALTGFPQTLRLRIQQLTDDGLLSIERACYMIHHGVWTVPEVEGLIRGSPYPDLILNGNPQPEQRHIYHHVKIHTRAAILGGYLDRALLVRHSDTVGDAATNAEPRPGVYGGDKDMDGNPKQEVEDDERNLGIAFDEHLFARIYNCPADQDPAPIPDWFAARQRPTAFPRAIEPGHELVALLRPRDVGGLAHHLAEDIDQARQEAPRRHTGAVVALLVPQDFQELPDGKRQELIKLAATAEIAVLVCPENAKTLDDYAREKLKRSRILPE